jgi:hypothetical protein
MGPGERECAAGSSGQQAVFMTGEDSFQTGFFPYLKEAGAMLEIKVHCDCGQAYKFDVPR